jgi:nucleotide-binding universal stress UspA family protein
MNTLLAVDGSENANEALRALKYFSPADQLILLHALDVPRPAYPMMVPEVTEELYREVERNMRENGERLLDRAVSLLAPEHGPILKRLTIGSPAEVIVATSEEERIDLIVMGARGIGPIRERLLGSVSHQVLTLAPCAKLIVPGPVKAPRLILLPLQGSFDAEVAIEFLRSKPFREPVNLILVTVVPVRLPPWPLAAAAAQRLEERELKDAGLFLEQTAARLQSLGYSAHCQALRGTTPAESILNEVKTQNADLILMGSRGRQGVTRFFLGSVSHAVLHQTSVPVLVFH